MKKINFKALIITCIMCLVPIIFGLIFYDSLPENVAIHFDVNNNPDNYCPKEFFVFGVPVVMMLFQIFCCVITDLKDQHPEANKKYVTVMKLIIPVINVLMYVVTLMHAMTIGIDIRVVVMIILGVMFVIMGNYIPKIVGTQNINFHFNMFEIKDEKLNNKIKRATGYVLIVDGFLFILSTLFKPIISVVIVGIIILQASVLSMYTIIKSKKEKTK